MSKMIKALEGEINLAEATVKIVCYDETSFVPTVSTDEKQYRLLSNGDCYWVIKKEDGTETPWCRETYTVGTHSIEDLNEFHYRNKIAKDLTEKGWTTIQGDYGQQFICPHWSARSSK